MRKTESSSIVVQWDEVGDSLPTTYTVTWTNENDHNIQSKTLEEQSSYTITGLTLDTVYTITVTASNKCGTGPEYSTSVLLTTDTTSSIIPTASTNSAIGANTTISTQSSTTTTTTNVNIATAIISTSNAMMSSSIVSPNTMTTVIISGDTDTTGIITTTSMVSPTSSRDASTTTTVVITTDTTDVVSSPSLTASPADTTTIKGNGEIIIVHEYSIAIYCIYTYVFILYACVYIYV